MRINTSSFEHLSAESSLRSDCVYQRLVSKRFDDNEEYYTFKDLFYVLEERIAASELIGKFQYCQIGDVEKDGTPCPVTLDFGIRALEDEGYYKKIEKGDAMRVRKNDILVSFLLPQDVSIKGKFTRIDDERKAVLFSTAFLRIIPRRNPEVLYYSLQSIFYNDLVATARIRKGYTGYATLSRDDLEDMRFSKNVIDALALNYDDLKEKIENIEASIADKKRTLKPVFSIIDSAFQCEFGFDYDKFEELKSHKHYISSQALFSNNPDLRFSAKYHRPAGDFVMEQLSGISDKKIKHFISEPIALGASVSPKDYDESGEYSYISMAAIKTWSFDSESASTVSDRYAAGKTAKTVRKNDIILARSGEGTIGKVAIITDEEPKGIFADFTMRIRLDESLYNPTFAYYYMRSRYFQYLVEVYKKGLGNNTNIFPVVIQEFPIPDISRSEQQRIVDQIQSEIKKQEQIEGEIAALRSQIDDIIIKTVTS